MKNIVAIFTCFALLFNSCSRGPYAGANRSYKKQTKELAKEIRRNPSTQTMSTSNSWVGTTNFNLRKPNIVIIHHTAQVSCDQTLKTFTTPRTQVSAHYVICEDGTIHHMLNDYLRAWHGGIGKWGSINDLNSTSIGIELDNDGTELFKDAQISNLLQLLDTLKKKYTIPSANFIAHSDIAPTRKVDPNVQFPWRHLAEKGFGLWWTDTTGVKLPDHFDNMQALRIIGYDMKDSSATIAAFNRKYLQKDNAKTLDDAGKKILYSLYRKHIYYLN